MTDWFNSGATQDFDQRNWRRNSRGPVTAEQFKEMVLDGISKMDPQIHKGEKNSKLELVLGLL